jgi:peptidoglycan/xylan/chitin deacetylase (PgdA/CDA1 family)
MILPARFILSLDCEGKWGMADHLDESHRRLFTHDRLLEAYHRIVRQLDARHVPATFAFVTAFTMTRAALEREPDLLRDATVGGIAWLAAYRREQAAGIEDGWFLPEALEIVRSSGRHEVACHGFSHAPLEGDEAVVRHELTSAVRIAERQGMTLRTLVYPRNRVAHTELLAEHGFWGYRTALATPNGAVGRAVSLMRELNLRQRAQPDPHLLPLDTAVPIPSGHFLNWRRGVRAAVPTAITVARWSAMLDDATRRSGVVHAWMHPHNIVTAPSTFDVLSGVVDAVCRARDRGRLEVVTQETYCRTAMADRGVGRERSIATAA